MTDSPRATPDQGSAELSDERIDAIAIRFAGRGGRVDYRAFARAILATATQPAPSAEPTDAEVDAALIAHHLQVVPLSRADMRRALTGFLRSRATATQGAPRVDLQAAIMNLPHKAPDDIMTPTERMGYGAGHRDARHAAAELVAAQGSPTPAQAVGFIRPDEKVSGRWVFVNYYEGRNSALAWEPVYRATGIHPTPPQAQAFSGDTENVRCTKCSWRGLVTDCGGFEQCDCPLCGEPITDDADRATGIHPTPPQAQGSEENRAGAVRAGEIERTAFEATFPEGSGPATVERLMELVRTLPPRSMRPERNAYLIEIEGIAATLRDAIPPSDEPLRIAGADHIGDVNEMVCGDMPALLQAAYRHVWAIDPAYGARFNNFQMAQAFEAGAEWQRANEGEPVPLTDEEVISLMDSNGIQCEPSAAFAIVEIVERAHGIDLFATIPAVDAGKTVESAASSAMGDDGWKLVPDPLGCLACTHPGCGRYEGPRSWECRAMPDNACARPCGVMESASPSPSTEDKR